MTPDDEGHTELPKVKNLNNRKNKHEENILHRNRIVNVRNVTSKTGGF